MVMVNEGYKEIIEKIVKSKVNAFGSTGVEKVNNINGITVDNQGNISDLSGPPKKVLEDILEIFEKLIGRTSTISAKTVTVELRKKYPDLDLPSKLVS